jgi:hypothetical protein
MIQEEEKITSISGYIEEDYEQQNTFLIRLLEYINSRDFQVLSKSKKDACIGEQVRLNKILKSKE